MWIDYTHTLQYVAFSLGNIKSCYCQECQTAVTPTFHEDRIRRVEPHSV